MTFPAPVPVPGNVTVRVERQANVDEVHGSLTNGVALDGEVVEAMPVVELQAAARQ